MGPRGLSGRREVPERDAEMVSAGPAAWVQPARAEHSGRGGALPSRWGRTCVLGGWSRSEAGAARAGLGLRSVRGPAGVTVDPARGSGRAQDPSGQDFRALPGVGVGVSPSGRDGRRGAGPPGRPLWGFASCGACASRSGPFGDGRGPTTGVKPQRGRGPERVASRRLPLGFEELWLHVGARGRCGSVGTATRRAERCPSGCGRGSGPVRSVFGADSCGRRLHCLCGDSDSRAAAHCVIGDVLLKSVLQRR